VREGSLPVAAGSGPVSEMSTNVRTGSRPMTGDGSIYRGTRGRLSGNPVRGSSVGGLNTGSVSDASVGSVATKLPPAASFAPPPEYYPAPETLPFDDAADDAYDSGVEDEDRGEAEVEMEMDGPVHELYSLSAQLRQIRPLPRTQDAADEDTDSVEDPDNRDENLINDAQELAEAESDLDGDAGEDFDEAPLDQDPTEPTGEGEGGEADESLPGTDEANAAPEEDASSDSVVDD